MEQAPGIGLLTTDRELVVRSWNPWLTTATGVGEADVSGRALLDLIPPDKRELYRDILVEVLERGTARVLAPAFHHYLFPCPPATPSAHFAHMQQRVTVAPLRGDGEAVGVMVTVEDMTAALDSQRALAARIEEAGGDRAPADVRAAVGAEDWRLRGAAVRALRQSASAEDVAHLLETLERDHQSLDVLSSALRVLISANRDVVPALIDLLSDPHPNLRMHAALALGELRDDAAVPALVGALEDDDANVRFHAIEALGRLGASAAVEPLTRIAASGDFFLSFPAIEALARTDDPRVAPNLVGLLRNDLLRPAVVDTLAALGDEESVAPLVAIINGSSVEAAAVAAALERMRDRYERTFAAGEQIVEMTRGALTSDGLRHLAEAIGRRDTPLAPLVVVYGWMGANAADVLATLVGEPTVQTEAAAAIMAIGRAAVSPLMNSLLSGERAARLAAAELLGRLGDRRAVPALCDLLAEADAELVSTAAAALATLGDSRALESLLALFGHEHAAVRQAAVAGVNATGAGAAEPRIRQRLSDADARVRESAVRVAGYFGFDTCLAGILAALDDPHEDVRRAAIEQLPVLDHPQAHARLAAALAEETPRNRAAAAHAARSADDRLLDGTLVAALGDPDPWVRYFAAGSLGERRNAAAAAALASLAASDPAPHVRIAAMQAVGAVDPDAAVPLAERLLREGDDDVACAGLTVLARARSRHVEELFEQAIRSASLSIRRCAIDALSSRRTLPAVHALAFGARMTDSPALAGAAVDALAAIAAAADGELSRAAATALLDIGIESGRRAEVVESLSRQSSGTIDVVAGTLNDPRAAARLTAVEALARMRHPRASAALAPALHDADPAVRAAAVSGFGRLGTPAAAPGIAALRDTDPDPAVRRKAAVVCERYGWGR
jgi:HEAT repeat protein